LNFLDRSIEALKMEKKYEKEYEKDNTKIIQE
jgi:hypothetical protein